LPQTLLQRCAIYLDDEAIDFVGQLVTPRFHFVAIAKNFLYATTETPKGDGFQTPPFKPFAKVAMGGKLHSFNKAGAVKKNIQGTFRRNRRIELF